MAVCCWLGKCALDLLNTIKRWCSRFLKRPLGISYAAYFEVFIHYLPFIVPPDLFGTNINYLPNRAKSRSSKWFHLLACRGRSANRIQPPLGQNPYKSVSKPCHAVWRQINYVALLRLLFHLPELIVTISKKTLKLKKLSECLHIG